MTQGQQVSRTCENLHIFAHKDTFYVFGEMAIAV